MERCCRIHGDTPFAAFKSEGRQRYRCKKCQSDAVKRRRKKVKELAIAYKGGKCEACGYNKSARALEFHHTDPAQKDFGISEKGETKSFERIKVELDKCIMLCANCHREEHDRLLLETDVL